MADVAKKPTLVVTGPGFLSYAHLHEPGAVEGSTDLKYSVKFVWPKNDTWKGADKKTTLQLLQDAVKAALEAGVPKCWKDATKAPNLKDFSNPIVDGDQYNEDRDAAGKKPDPALAGCYFINCKSSNKPGLVKKLAGMKVPVEITEQEKTLVYSGANARVSLNLYPFNNKSIGIGAGLNNVCVIGGGTPLAGGTDAIDDFSDDDVEFRDTSVEEEVDPEA